MFQATIHYQLIQEMRFNFGVKHSWLYPLIGLAIGLVAWSGIKELMPVALLILPAWFHAPKRWIAWLTVFAYLAAASYVLPAGTMRYFETVYISGILIWLSGVCIASVLYYVLFFNDKKWRITGLYVALITTALPPLGLTSWSHPVTSTGIWWPGGGWLALVVFLACIPLVCRYPVVISLPILLGLFLPHTPLQPPDGWQAIHTSFKGEANQRGPFTPATAADFQKDYFMQLDTIKKVNAAKAEVMLLPEGSGGTWLTANKGLWQSRLRSPGTVLINATVPAKDFKENLILAVSKNSCDVVYKQRQPVPLSMWLPGIKHSYQAHWFDNPVVTLRDTRIAFFICYEQFLTWPVLQSVFASPSLLCAINNVWWAAGNKIPTLQHNIMQAWSQLFSIPLLTATNH